MDRQWIIAGAFYLLSTAGFAGEIIGNTYIGEKQGYIEIQSPGGKWEFQDREGQGNMIANLTLKDPISGTRPTMLFFGIPKIEGVTVDQMAQWGREAMEKQGAELGPLETRRYGGKQVVIYTGTMTKGSVRAVMQVFLIEGPKTYFQVSGAASAAAYEGAKPLFEEVIEKLKY